MTQDDIDEALACLGRAIVALTGPKPDADAAEREVIEALAAMRRVPDVYADRALRPGLNKPTESAADV